MEGVAAAQQQLGSIGPGCRLAAYWVSRVGSGQRCCRPLNADPLGGTNIPTRGQQKESQSLADGIGCSLLLMGTVGGLFGLAALLGISDRIELEFFEIQLNDTPGRLAWTAGCLAAVVIGILVLRARKRAA